MCLKIYTLYVVHGIATMCLLFVTYHLGKITRQNSFIPLNIYSYIDVSYANGKDFISVFISNY